MSDGIFKGRRADKQRCALVALERVIVDAVSGMDPEDAIGTVLVHYADGSVARLADVIERANELRAGLP